MVLLLQISVNFLMEDETIGKVIQLKRECTALTASKKSRVQRSLEALRNIEKLNLGNGVLYIHNTDKQQLVLS